MDLKDGLDYSLESEYCIIGTVLRNNKTFRYVESLMDPDLFASMAHIDIWSAVCAEADAGRAYNADTIYSLLSGVEGKGNFSAIPDLKTYLRQIEEEGCHEPSLQVPSYIEILRECRIRRGLTSFYKEGLRIMAEEPEKMSNVLAGAFNGLSTLQHMGRGSDGFVSLSDAFTALRTPSPQGKVISTGFEALDAIGGFPRAGVTILGGRASMGKSGFLIEAAYRAAKRGERVDIFSMEMNREQIAARILSSSIASERNETRSTSVLPYQSIYEERFNPEWVNLVDRHEAMNAEVKSFNLCDRAGLTVSDIRAMCLSKRGDLDLVVIDYLNIMEFTDLNQGLRHDQKLGKVMSKLRAFAKDTGAAVILLCQLNRGTVNRENRVPQIQDLRDSGELEQHADTIIFVHRESYYLKREIDAIEAAGQVPSYELKSDYLACQHVMDIIYAKQRMGKIDKAMLRADMPTNYIRDWTRQEKEQMARVA